MGLSWSETPEHLFLKSLIVQAATEAGWNARTEVPSPDGSWIADTLLEKNGRTVAFEVQWSKQDDETYQFRQERYRQYGIDCIWLRRYRKHEYAHPQVPLLDVIVELEEQVAATRSGEPVEAAVQRVLASPLVRYSSTPCWISSCWKCQSDIVVWDAPRESYHEEVRHDRSAWFRNEVARFTAQKGVSVPTAMCETKYSNTVSASYLALCCPSCRSLQGDFFLSQERLEAEYLGGWLGWMQIISGAHPTIADADCTEFGLLAEDGLILGLC